MSRKWLSIVLALALVLILVPGSALASTQSTVYQSSHDVFPNVELVSTSTNSHTRALMAWYQQGSAHIAIKSTHILQRAQIGSFTISALTPSDRVDLHPVGASISIDGVSYNAGQGLIGNTGDARWTVFKFPVDDTFTDSGIYSMSVTGRNNSASGHSLSSVTLQIVFADDSSNTPTPTEGASNPGATPTPTEGATNPGATPTPTEGATNPGATPTPTEGATNPGATPTPTEGATNPGATPTPTEGATNPGATPTPTEGATNPGATPTPTEGATNPGATPAPTEGANNPDSTTVPSDDTTDPDSTSPSDISSDPSESEQSTDGEDGNDAGEGDGEDGDEDDSDLISVIDDETPQGAGENDQGSTGSDNNNNEQTVDLDDDSLPLAPGSSDLDDGDKQAGNLIEIPDLEVPQVRPGNANNLFQELVNIIDEQIPQTGQKITSAIIGILLISLAAVLVFLRRRSLKH